MTEPGSGPRADRRGFAATVAPGVLAAALAAVASAKSWAVPAGATARMVPSGAPELTGAGQVPVAAALALVVLAAWGAVLVTRAGARTIVAVIGSLASLALLAVAIRGGWSAPAGVRHAVAGFVGGAGEASVDTSRTGWYWLALVASVVCVLAFARATVAARGWPTMSTRYDAPGTRGAGTRDAGTRNATPDAGARSAAEATPRTNREWWTAIDEGRDPTAPPE